MDNYNLIAYSIYLPITFYITIVVGKTCYNNGEVYLSRIINDHPETVRSINSILLVGYYLLNLGYAAITLSFWQEIHNIAQMIEILGRKLGTIILFLGLMHFNNMLVTYVISKRINKKSPLKTSLS